MLIEDLHHGTLGPTATLTTIYYCWDTTAVEVLWTMAATVLWLVGYITLCILVGITMTCHMSWRCIGTGG